MLNAEAIIAVAQASFRVNKGIEAITQADCCIMDEQCTDYTYKDEGGCLDYKKCGNTSYMLACLASRHPEELKQWVVDTYNEAMEKDSV